MTVQICDICSTKSKSRNSLVEHFKTHSIGRLLQCRFCGVRVSQLSNLKRHEDLCPAAVRNASQNGAAGLQSAARSICHCLKCSKCIRRLRNNNVHNPFYCDICDRGFSWFPTLTRHISNKHFLTEPLQCGDCEKFFISRDGLYLHATASHLASAVDSSSSSPLCEDCQKGFSSYRQLLVHAKVVHNKLKSEFCYCAICQKGFGNDRRLSTHRCVNINRQQKTPFECDVCEKKFLATWLGKSHVARVHVAKINDLLQCPKCGQRFATMQTLKVHQQRRHKKRFTSAADECLSSCRICGKRFSDKVVLERHTRRHHQQERPRRFACSLCEKDYSLSSSLKTHVQEQHDGRIIASHKCDSCDKVYCNKSKLSAHVALHHIISGRDISADPNGDTATELRAANARPEFQCSICVQRCSSKHGLRLHELLHREKKAYFSCQFCDLTTASEGSLYQHERRHTRRSMRVICFSCKRSFAGIATLREHVKYRHGAPSPTTVQCDLCAKTLAGSSTSVAQHFYRIHGWENASVKR